MKFHAVWRHVKGTAGHRCGSGIEAQTLANVYLALEHNLEIIPVINKIDLPSADVEKVKRELEEVIGLPERKLY